VIFIIIGITFKNTDSVTLGGFLTEQMQQLPRKGEKFVYEGYTFTIHKTTERRVHQVLISPIKK
jgi:CBS domain containing-hemolysin-like protein